MALTNGADGVSQGELSSHCHVAHKPNDQKEDEDDTKTVVMEDVLQEIGVPSRYQLIQVVCTSLCITPMAFAMLNFVFIGYEPSTLCNVANETELLVKISLYNDSGNDVEYESCYITIFSTDTRNSVPENIDRLDCVNGYEYLEGEHVSMVSEWDLVCNKRGIAEFAQTVLTLGMAISSVVVTAIADRFGRKYTLIISTGALIITEVGLAFSDDVYKAIVLRFLSGLSAGTMFVVHNVINSELNISKYRQIYSACKYVLWSFNVMLLAGVAFVFKHKDWRHLQLVSALCGAPVFLAALKVKETPAWYITQGRVKDAQRVVLNACKTNGKDAQQALEILHKCMVASSASVARSRLSSKNSLLDLVRNKKLLIRVLILCFIWFNVVSTYFGLFLTSATLAGDRYINFFLMAVLEIPSCLSTIPLLVYFGRRTVVMMFMVMSVLCLLVSTCLVAKGSSTSDSANASTAFFLLGKFATGAAYNVIVSYTPELFPTTLRSTGTGLCAAVAWVGAMLAPFLNPLFRIVKWAPGAILLTMNFLAFLFLWTVPETKEKELPTTIEDMVALNDKRRTNDKDRTLINAL